MTVLLMLILAPLVAGGSELEIPSNVANRSMIIKGTLLCGDKGMKGANVRLFRVYQKDAVDDLSQLLDQSLTYETGFFQIQGNTMRFPSTQTEIQPFVTIHHNCDMDEKQTANLGYKRWAIRLPEDYVTIGTRARKTYDFGRVNLQLEYPGEMYDKKFSINI
ncbi:Transthyretin-like family protein [Dictyocaulus viviparus]|uniref:Transthyretin-like family protein n=1 Tax=Dictyocaulus viviparus TaxID=29172 RepID=A0A0D8XID4_DICVI|nr:Transthyretin-like family protein [Dictyocaulus viviparus]